MNDPDAAETDELEGQNAYIVVSSPVHRCNLKSKLPSKHVRDLLPPSSQLSCIGRTEIFNLRMASRLYISILQAMMLLSPRYHPPRLVVY
jgi:hypothetical protein